MIEEEGPLFAKGVGSLVVEGWQTHAIHAYETLFSFNEWFTKWMHHVQLRTIQSFVLQNKEEFIST
jgi:hypothetical protein